MSSTAAAAPEKKKKKGKFFRRIRETFAELKKVTWPTFRQTLKQTGVVIAVVVVFAVIITLANMGLSALLDLLMQRAVTI